LIEPPDRETMDVVAMRNLTGAIRSLRDTIENWEPLDSRREQDGRAVSLPRTVDDVLGTLTDQIRSGAGLPGRRY